MELLPAGLTPMHEKLPEKTLLTDSRTSLLGSETWREDNWGDVDNRRSAVKISDNVIMMIIPPLNSVPRVHVTQII